MRIRPQRKLTKTDCESEAHDFWQHSVPCCGSCENEALTEAGLNPIPENMPIISSLHTCQSRDVGTTLTPKFYHKVTLNTCCCNRSSREAGQGLRRLAGWPLG